MTEHASEPFQVYGISLMRRPNEFSKCMEVRINTSEGESVLVGEFPAHPQGEGRELGHVDVSAMRKAVMDHRATGLLEWLEQKCKSVNNMTPDADEIKLKYNLVVEYILFLRSELDSALAQVEQLGRQPSFSSGEGVITKADAAKMAEKVLSDPRYNRHVTRPVSAPGWHYEEARSVKDNPQV